MGINIPWGGVRFSIVNMVGMKRRFVRRRRFRRGLRQCIVHSYQNQTTTSGNSSIKANALKIIDRPARIRWARIRCSANEPKFVKLLLVSPAGAAMRTSSMTMCHKGITTIFLRAPFGNDFGSYKDEQGVVEIYSNSGIIFSLTVCMDYSYPLLNNPVRQVLSAAPDSNAIKKVAENAFFVEDNTIQEEEKEIRT